MLSSIHPLGERGRHNRWAITVTSFTLASTAAGAAMGASLGWFGGVTPFAVPEQTLLVITATGAIVSGSLDLLRVTPPGPERQVNETWIGHFRGWVYGGAFGLQLGAGVVTFVVTWGVYATFLAELLTGSLVRGALVGATFGLGRSVALLAAGTIRIPSSLTRFHEHLANLGLPIRRGAAIGTASVGAVSTLALLI